MEKQKPLDKPVELKPLNTEHINVKIRGLTPLLHEKGSIEVASNIDKKKSNKLVEKDTKSEEDKVEEKIWYTEDGNVGFPVSGFMKGMIEVAPYIGITKKDVRSAVRILGNVTPITYKKKTVNVSIGKTSGMTKHPRKIMRPEFQDWSCELEIVFDTSILTAEKVINLLNRAGFNMGLGGWRPDKGGSYGQYEVFRK